MTERNLNFYDPQKRPWPNPRLSSGSIIGHTTATSVRLWFRVREAGGYWLVVSRHPIPTEGTPYLIGENHQYQFRVATPTHTQEISLDTLVPLQVGREHDLTTVVDLADLKPETRYYYAVFEPHRDSPWELGHEEMLSFETFPEHPTEVNFGLYSCHMPYDGRKFINLETWDSFYEELCDAKARFVVAGGDQVYVDGEEEISIWEWLRQVKHENPSLEDMISWYRDIYKGYWGFPEVQRVFRTFPTYMIWDDHDIVDGWGSYQPDELAGLLDTSWHLRNQKEQLRLAYEMFQAAKTVYWEYQHSHNPQNLVKEQEQWDYEFQCGCCAFYVLDMRGFRDYNRNECRTLGVEQWNRFEEWLSKEYDSSSRVLFIVSPVPVVHLSSFAINKIDLTLFGYQDDQRDHWEHETNWDERNRMLGLVFKLSQETKRPVIFLSGDVHIGAAFQLSHPHFPGAKVFQLTSSGITYADLKKLGRRILETLVAEEGNLGDRKDSIPYHFRNLSVCRYNNFGIVRVTEKEDRDVNVVYDLFGGYFEEDGTFCLTKTRLDLDRLP